MTIVKRWTLLAVVLFVVVVSIAILQTNHPGGMPSPVSTVAPGGGAANASGAMAGNTGDAPDFVGITHWINSPPLTMQSLHGKVVLVDFWTYSCINCIRTLPYLEDWYSKYRKDGLVIVGVHTPEFAFEKVQSNVEAAVKRFNITYPVAMDNNYATWDAYANQYWPRDYLIGRNGNIRYNHIGEGGYAQTEKEIQKLLSESGTMMNQSTVRNPLPDLNPLTPEQYLGYQYALPRGEDIGNPGGFVQDVAHDYTLPSVRSADTIYLNGTWTAYPEYIQAGADASLYFTFHAEDIYVVASTANRTRSMGLTVDGSAPPAADMGADVTREGAAASVAVSEPRLYALYSGPYQVHTLVLHPQAGVRINSFTFG